jgi:predicted CXXCH cytochrome family protein
VLWPACLAGAFLVVGLFFAGLAAKERDNRFCVACHLHDTKFARLIDARPTDLGGFHHAKDARVGCIACHGGGDTAMLFKVWALAGLDTVRFLAGAYEEPTRMRLALRDAECRQCHMPILRPRRAPGAAGSAQVRSAAGGAALDPADESTFAAEAETEGRGETYHAIREHDTVDVRCVRCHTAHTTDSDAGNRFISRPRTVTVCRGCHKEM